jgi:signal transduction histidine kinase/DNA-binding NarL/FixJ family response regulator
MAENKNTPGKPCLQNRLSLALALSVFCAGLAATVALVYLPRNFEWPPWSALPVGFLLSGLLAGCVLRVIDHAAKALRQSDGSGDTMEESAGKIADPDHFLKCVVESFPYPFHVVDAKDHSIVMANSATDSYGDWRDSTCYAFTHQRSTPCETAGEICPLTEIRKTGRPFTVEHAHFIKDGDCRYFEVHAAPIFDEGGELIQMLEYSVDITERKKNEEKLAHYRDHLEQMVTERTLESEEALRKAEAASLAKSEFLAVMSHELRTPLTAILGFSEILLRRPEDKTAEKTKEYLEHIHGSGLRLLTLVDDILNLGEPCGKTGETRMEQVDIVDLISRVSQPFLKGLEKKGIRLVTTVENGLRWANTDEQTLRKILGNLLSNAVKFSSAGGEITVAAGFEEGGEALEISVIDTGIGISEENLERIFEPFSQVDASITRRYDGVGLGLARSRQLAECLGGRIRVKSSPGEGSTFILTLPVQLTAAVDPKPPAPCLPGKIGARILVAEDNLVNLKLAQAMLETLGCRVDAALTGREAVEACMRNDYDLVLMDCQMPEMDGYEATREIRDLEGADPGRRRTPVVALTAHVLGGDRARCVEVGMDGFLCKPFAQDRLVRILKRFFLLESRERGSKEEDGSVISATEEESRSFSEVPSIDRKFLDRIRVIQSRGNSGLLRKIIDIYLQETPKLLQILRDASDRSDAQGLRQAAHSLKSSSANLGATRLARICEEVEALARSEETSKARPLVARLENEYPTVRSTLEAEH